MTQASTASKPWARSCAQAWASRAVATPRPRQAGATILDAPADYPQYGSTYYSVFVADPDGMKLEYAYTG